MKLLVDGVFFQLNNSGIARVWRSILPYVAADSEMEVFILDRGDAPAVEGATLVPFPSRKLSEHSACDSALIQRMCDFHGIDIFTSTYYTTPLSTPMLLMVYDMIPELFGFDLTQRAWMDKELAISFARRHLCISNNTREDLLAFYPEIDPTTVTVSHCGVDSGVFKSHPQERVRKLREQIGLHRDYFLFVGARVQHTGYKNSKLFFDALARMPDTDFDVLCVGGEEHIEPEVLRGLPAGVKCMRAELSDEELALAYNGAVALVYPSLYEGFGMPVIEAMASGCPVITTHYGSLGEAAGNAACTVSGYSVEEMCEAISNIRNLDYRDELKQRGLVQARQFRWSDMAKRFCAEARALHQHNASGDFDDFFSEWRRLREIQASVDF
ncbi:MAG: glycosyltransferase family 4 protein [Betaproteobacteria bacterium]|nr:glycosyltransferase family 4 protein [Betaproteobacteria bacterium]